uniref:Uncharacterized protein n=1 Tax=Micrurus corallinus TaxID=54390 RepID=A0A2D4GS85_MICCO
MVVSKGLWEASFSLRQWLLQEATGVFFESVSLLTQEASSVLKRRLPYLCVESQSKPPIHALSHLRLQIALNHSLGHPFSGKRRKEPQFSINSKCLGCKEEEVIQSSPERYYGG